jgi:nicotinate dehydrogenase subunit B
MRTPGQRQHNFVLEGLINQAAGAGADPIQFRISHTTDQQLIDMLSATAQAAGWEPWPAPHSTARRTGTAPVTRRGVCIVVSSNG